ncbi:transposon ty3-g Gag-Pol polyprotein [Plakobranchus ocellatus]|uniref:Transposon ty3-g Gag-Pol polyprotein n=1 Tax=Plakobranchus ocellatus TaxID=259542 RepID=A0AAV4DN88_9GAST|nr:transposon ty3-g Gag-Pol polyprotein [Plakobranchus ocellatus]
MSQPQGESTQTLLAPLTSQLQSMTVQPNISAVSLKLPEFWTTSPEVWFARVEAQFGTKNISTDQTKYDYVVSALDVKTAEEVQEVLVNPPDANKYSVLKRALLKALGKSQAQRDNELLNLNGLGDRKPTALLRKINALNDDPQSPQQMQLFDSFKSLLDVAINRCSQFDCSQSMLDVAINRCSLFDSFKSLLGVAINRCSLFDCSQSMLDVAINRCSLFDCSQSMLDVALNRCSYLTVPNHCWM